MFAFTGLAFAALAAFTIYRMSVRAAPTEAQKENFVYVPRTSPAVFQLDPRGEPEDEEHWGEPAPLPEIPPTETDGEDEGGDSDSDDSGSDRVICK